MLPLCVEFMKIYLGFAFLHTIDDNEMMKKWVDFVEIKLHSNENVEWHCINLNSIWFE
jgi:hypothetical protein